MEEYYPPALLKFYLLDLWKNYEISGQISDQGLKKKKMLMCIICGDFCGSKWGNVIRRKKRWQKWGPKVRPVWFISKAMSGRESGMPSSVKPSVHNRYRQCQALYIEQYRKSCGDDNDDDIDNDDMTTWTSMSCMYLWLVHLAENTNILGGKCSHILAH